MTSRRGDAVLLGREVALWRNSYSAWNVILLAVGRITAWCVAWQTAIERRPLQTGFWTGIAVGAGTVVIMLVLSGSISFGLAAGLVMTMVTWLGIWMTKLQGF